MVGDVFTIKFRDPKIIDSPRIREIGEDLGKSIANLETNKVVLSFTGVAFMGSAMIGKIIEFKKKCDNAGLDVRFCEISKNIMEAVTVLQLHRRWTIYKTMDEALKAFSK